MCYCVVSTGKYSLAFRKNIVPPSRGSSSPKAGVTLKMKAVRFSETSLTV